MKQNKYIPGDWIKYIGNNSPRYVQIWQVRENFLFLESGYGMVNFSEVEPIPLTPEILEKNGWNKEEKDGSILSLSEAFMGGDENDEGNYTCFQLYYQNKKEGWVIDMRGELLKFDIHYVHELQHLFFGLGLDSNFDLTDTKKGE